MSTLVYYCVLLLQFITNKSERLLDENYYYLLLCLIEKCILRIGLH